jgi:hypothetical protein
MTIDLYSGVLVPPSRIEQYISAKQQLTDSIVEAARPIVSAVTRDIIRELKNYVPSNEPLGIPAIHLLIAQAIKPATAYRSPEIVEAGLAIRKITDHYERMAGLQLVDYRYREIHTSQYDMEEVIALGFYLAAVHRDIEQQIGSFPKLLLEATIEPYEQVMWTCKLTGWELLERADLQVVANHYQQHAVQLDFFARALVNSSV